LLAILLRLRYALCRLRFIRTRCCWPMRFSYKWGASTTQGGPIPHVKQSIIWNQIWVAICGRSRLEESPLHFRHS
jgi:hypothetical protein